MCANFSKFEGSCSQALSQAVKERAENNIDNCQKLKPVAHTYVSTKERVTTEGVYFKF